jgi:3-deoxy-D-manno-octulosonic-acid transferase
VNLLYSVATLFALIVFAPYFLYQALRHHKYVGSLGQRLGYLPVSFNLDAEESIWVHAVSVGEVLAARPVIAGLRERYPDLRLFLSTTTMSGQQIARSVADVDAVFYFPFDFTFIVRRTLNLVKPRLFVMIETEIWPNLLRECRRRGIRTALVNGRLSPRSYSRYRIVRPFIRRVLADIDRFCVQSEEMARRFRSLGAKPSDITVTGSLKFDSLDPSTAPGRGRERVLRFFRISSGRPVLVAGSTSRGEEDAVIRAFNRLRMTTAGGNALLILAARHPERFNEVERLCQQEVSRPRAAAICRSTRSRKSTRSSSIRSASWRSSIRSRPRCSSAAASCRRADTTSSSRGAWTARSSSDRTWTTSPRSHMASSRRARRFKSARRASSRTSSSACAAIRCVARSSEQRRVRWSTPIAVRKTRH